MMSMTRFPRGDRAVTKFTGGGVKFTSTLHIHESGFKVKLDC